ncbi:MAG: transcriptional regulator [Bacteroidia bacterium]|nr:transcriptional regulator [Bacteroidia bacterium]
MYKDLDPLLHSQLRLTIVSHLVKQPSSDFKELKELTNANSGNVSIQLNKLEQAGYITLTKSFKDNYPHTSVELTPAGLAAFEAYVDALKGYLNQE